MRLLHEIAVWELPLFLPSQCPAGVSVVIAAVMEWREISPSFAIITGILCLVRLNVQILPTLWYDKSPKFCKVAILAWGFHSLFNGTTLTLYGRSRLREEEKRGCLDFGNVNYRPAIHFPWLWRQWQQQSRATVKRCQTLKIQE